MHLIFSTLLLYSESYRPFENTVSTVFMQSPFFTIFKLKWLFMQVCLIYFTQIPRMSSIHICSSDFVAVTKLCFSMFFILQGEHGFPFLVSRGSPGTRSLSKYS